MAETYLLSLNEVAKRTSLSRSQVNILRSQGKFPRAVPLGEKRIGFLASEIEAWINERVAIRDRVAA